jgi:hypothetical protein
LLDVQAAARRNRDNNSDDGGDAHDSDNDDYAPAAAAAEPRPASPPIIEKLTTRCCRLCNKGSCYDDCKWYTPSCAHSFHGKKYHGACLLFRSF